MASHTAGYGSKSIKGLAALGLGACPRFAAGRAAVDPCWPALHRRRRAKVMWFREQRCTGTLDHRHRSTLVKECVDTSDPLT